MNDEELTEHRWDALPYQLGPFSPRRSYILHPFQDVGSFLRTVRIDVQSVLDEAERILKGDR